MIDDRYLRNNLIDWFSQTALQKLHIGIIGCGAVGNEVVKNLALLGIGNIDVYDFDKIEAHNLTRSILFREYDIGKNKAEVVAERAREIDPNITVHPFVGDFWNILALNNLQKYDAIICCVDNFEARLKLNKLCVLFSKDFIDTGIDSRYVAIDVYPLSKNNLAACYECNLPRSVYKQIEKRFSCGWLRNISFREKIIPTTTITASIAGAIATSYVLRLKNPSIIKSKRIFFDTITGYSTQTDLIENPNCPTCLHQDKTIVINVSPKISALISGFSSNLAENLPIYSSEPILTKIRCINCCPKENEASTIFKKASDYDSSLAICPKCGKQTNLIDIKDMFTINEFIRDYKDLNIPCKFLYTKLNNSVYIFNLEE